MLPVTELRAALPLGVVWGLTPRQAFIWALAGNLVPVLPALLAFGRIFGCLRFFDRGLVAALAEHGRRHREQLRRLGLPGLTALVAVPLPGTGIWTGCLVAALLGLEKPASAAAIALGAAGAGALVALASAGVAAAGRLGGLAAAAAATVAVAALFRMLFRRK